MSITIKPETYYRLHEVRLARGADAAKLPALRALIDEALFTFVVREAARQVR
jgi:hypothetical protein